MKLLKRFFRLVSLPTLLAGAALVAGATLLTGCIADTGSEDAKETTLATAAWTTLPQCPVRDMAPIDGHLKYWEGIAYNAKRQMGSTTDPIRRKQLLATLQNAQGSLKYWEKYRLDWGMAHRCSPGITIICGGCK
jgi:hypothetical protein